MYRAHWAWLQSLATFSLCHTANSCTYHLLCQNPLDSSTWNFPQIRRYVELLILPNSGLPFLWNRDTFPPNHWSSTLQRAAVGSALSPFPHTIILSTAVTTSASPRPPACPYLMPDLNRCDTTVAVLHFLSTTMHSILCYDEQQSCHWRSFRKAPTSYL